MSERVTSQPVNEPIRDSAEKAVLDKLIEMYMPPVIESTHSRAEAIAGASRPKAKDFMIAIQEYIPGVPAIMIKQRWS